MSLLRTSRTNRQILGAAALLMLTTTACSTGDDAPSEELQAATASDEQPADFGAVTLEGESGTIELTGDADADIAALVPDFGREYTEGIACDPPTDTDIVAMSRWPGELRFIGEQYPDEVAARDAIRVTVHYDCPEHYDDVVEALG